MRRTEVSAVLLVCYPNWPTCTGMVSRTELSVQLRPLEPREASLGNIVSSSVKSVGRTVRVAH